MSNDAILEALGRRLRGAFALADLSPTQAAGNMGVQPATVRRWLAKPGEVKAKVFLDMCSAAGADSGQILTEAIEDARAALLWTLTAQGPGEGSKAAMRSRTSAECEAKKGTSDG